MALHILNRQFANGISILYFSDSDLNLQHHESDPDTGVHVEPSDSQLAGMLQ